jgi:hypothetical protein
MKALLIGCTCLVLVSASALACRGTVEFPQAAAQLAQAQLPAAEKATLTKRLNAAETQHQRGHDTNSEALMKESLQVLDEIKIKIAK